MLNGDSKQYIIMIYINPVGIHVYADTYIRNIDTDATKLNGAFKIYSRERLFLGFRACTIQYGVNRA